MNTRKQTLKRKRPLRRSTGLTRHKGLSRISRRRRSARREYQRRRALYLAEHEKCECCGEKTAVQIHHKNGRKGGNYTATHTFMAVCLGCHDFIHRNPKWAEEVGYLSKNR